MEEVLYSIALRKTPNVGNILFKTMVDAVGSAKEVWNMSKKDLIGLFRIGNSTVRHIGNASCLSFAEKEIAFCEQHQIKIRLRHRGELPFLLDECYDAPAILYQRGEYDSGCENISIVGTRNATAYGKSFLGEFVPLLKNKNIQIISGLALGIDGLAHQIALDNDIKTSAVLAHGLHLIYPAKHRELADKILNSGGALFSEFNSSDKPDREHFLQRNRIVAGLSQNLIVVETAFAGGSMSTVSFANQYNREVYALPGRLNDKCSQGCNLIIFQNKAKTIPSIKALIKDIGLNSAPKTMELFPNKDLNLRGLQKDIYEIIKDQPNIFLDDIAERLNENSFKILPILLELELLELVACNSGRQYYIK
ncbi:DNA-processing protein DprA [Riemerella columbipharyngis]|uniref:DNA processing protein n=1 Tax=Riemerella columbipharyngis TaxID=1071918 RepID=A0A1G7DL88_9FLAO|nr:DNA-processing protein DprA [Riemerella columbipharyngis]SDE52279.1 DNA processing protein [Riemerella columbipharyngis]